MASQDSQVNISTINHYSSNQRSREITDSMSQKARYLHQQQQMQNHNSQYQSGGNSTHTNNYGNMSIQQQIQIERSFRQSHQNTNMRSHIHNNLS